MALKSASNIRQSDLVYILTNQTNCMERSPYLKALVVHIDKKVDTFYGKQMLISMFRRTRYRYQFCTKGISTHNHILFFKFYFNIILTSICAEYCQVASSVRLLDENILREFFVSPVSTKSPSGV
jgi:hypothetical protein